MQAIWVLDTTLRDGAQAEGYQFSLEDKYKIALRLDELGVDMIEAGNPGANDKDRAFFQKPPRFSHAKLVAFGSTRHAQMPAEKDPGLATLLACGAEVISLFGKSWDFHAEKVLRVSLQKNLDMIGESVAYLSERGLSVHFDAEHFFDGCLAQEDYALETLRVAQQAGAKSLVLCDTNGGRLPWEIERMTRAALGVAKVPVGIHCHNDGGMAVANSLMAVAAGATFVQGTMGGLGERCGNADLSSILPALELKMGLSCLPAGKLQTLTSAARYIAEVANQTLSRRAPYVGYSAFAHKGGMHVDGVRKASQSFEHIPPEAVGNSRRLLISDQAGRTALLEKLKGVAPELSREDPKLEGIIAKLKEQEHKGYAFEAAEGSLQLMVLRQLGRDRQFFQVEDFRVFCEKPWERSSAQAYIKVVVHGKRELTAAEGDGPVDALDKALRKALGLFYPQLNQVRLVDFKVRVLDSGGTASTVRVQIESTDGIQVWGTVGVSVNIIEACWQALVDSIEYKLSFLSGES